MGLNRALLGKVYPEVRYKVELEAMKAYALATNEDNPLLVGPGAEMASPMFAVVWLAEPMMHCLFDGELIADANIGRMVHGGQDMRFVQVVRAGQTIVTKARVAGIEEKSTGELLHIALESKTEEGEQVLEATASFFFRGPPDPERAKSKRIEETLPDAGLFESQLRVDSDQTFRYAEASGDRNPIHTDEDTARMMGFDGIIVHGLCTMALAQKAVIDGALDGRPERLRRLQVQFAKPVSPGDVLDLRAWSLPEKGRLGFVVHSEGGQSVLREALAEYVVEN